MQQQPYKDLVGLAKVCFRQACACIWPEAAAELRLMAKEYWERAAALNGKKLPE